VFASGKRFPEEFFERAASISDKAGIYLREELANSSDVAGLDAEERAVAEKVAAYYERVMDLSADLMDRFVVYSRGVTPVVRWLPEDPSGMTKLLDDIAAELGPTLEAKEREGGRYWELVIDDTRGFVTLQDGLFSASAASTDEAAEELLEHLFGEPSGDAAAISATLAEIRKTYSLGPEAAGYLDTARLLDASPVGPSLSAECRQQVEVYTKAMPRLVAGYEGVTESTATFRSVIELEPAVAEQLRGWVAPMPAIAGSQALFAFAVSLETQEALLGLVQFQKLVAEQSSACGQPMDGSSMASSVTPLLLGLGVAGNPKGLRMSVDGFTPGATNLTESMALTTIISAENPEATVGLAAQRFPIASILESRGKPVLLELPGILPAGIYAAVTKNAIGVATGPNAEKRLSQTLDSGTAPAGTFLSLELDFTQLSDLLRPQLAEGGLLRTVLLQQAEQRGTSGPNPREQAQREIDQMLSMLEMYQELLGRVSASLMATPKGVEFREEIVFK